MTEMQLDIKASTSETHVASGFQMAVAQLRKNYPATIGLMFLVALTLAAIFAPWVAPYDPIGIAISNKLQPPSMAHWLGTDYFGRDVLSRMLYGARVSLTVGLLVAALAVVCGMPIGLLAANMGQNADNILMRFMDAFLTFPPLLLAVAIVGLLGADIWTVTLAIGIVQVPVVARIVRGSTLAVKEETYVRSSVALGAGFLRIAVRHLIPNILPAVLVQVTVAFSAAVVAEASLSFLGLGVQPPTPSWGRDLSEARRYMADAPWLFLSPTSFFIAAIMSINFLGDGLRDALDPKSWEASKTREGDS